MNTTNAMITSTMRMVHNMSSSVPKPSRLYASRRIDVRSV
jgi:hypothetical protein